MTENGNGNGNGTNGQRPRLTGLQRAFIDHWFGDAQFNAYKAAKLAGYQGDYGTLRSIGSENLTKPNIKAEIEYRWATYGMMAEEVIGRLAAMARGNVADYIHPETGAINWQAVQSGGAIVKKIKHQKGKQSEIELYDAQRALELVGKTMGLFRDRVEHSGQDGGDLVIRFMGNIRPDDV